MQLYHKVTGELAEMAAWSEDSLGYARKHDRRKLIRLLEAVKAEIELEDALLALPFGENLGSRRRSA